MRFGKLLSVVLVSTLVACQGLDGTDGVNGADGADGMDGVDGMDGSDGADGADGADGVDGLDGADGTDGVDGADGIDGSDGADGADGASLGVLRLSLTGLVDLGADFAYEGWVIVDGAPVSTGVFHVDADGYQTQSTFAVPQADLDAASTFVLTIEPVPDPDPAPSSTHILGGDFVEDAATVTVDHATALGYDYGMSTGDFILATPSSADTSDEANGIWWLDPMGGPAATLDLPDLTDSGWTYEGWVVGPDGPVSTGRFDVVDMADDDGAGPTAGPDGTPPFPGQDFVVDGMSLVGYDAVITIEPVPDNDPAPFGSLKPLAATIGADLAPTLQPMMNGADTFPAGSVTR